jgi:DNA-binding transcriptional LysR family regulator
MLPMHLCAYIDAMTHHVTAPSPGALRDLPALADFAAVARLGHMTRAAEVLGVPQSTLSRRVARLERAVGVPLLARTGRRVETTGAGRILAEAVERALRELDSGLDELAREDVGRTGVVSLAFLHTLGAEVVPRVIREFRSRFPGIGFRLAQEGHEEVVRLLRAGEVDLCLTAPLPEGSDLTAKPLQRQRLCLAVPRTHALSRVRGVALAEVADEPFVGFKHGYGMRRITDAWCHQAGFTPTLTFEGQDVATVRGLVAAGLGIALLPPATGSPPPGVVEVVVQSPPATRTIGVAWQSDRPLASPARAFRAFVLDAGPALMATPAYRER